MIKLILSDMDGTLVDSKGELPSDFPEVFAAMKQKGILFAAASGRQYSNLIELFTAYKDDMLFLTENGAYVAYQGREIYSNPLPERDVKRILKFGMELCQTAHFDLVINGKKAAYIMSDNPFFLENVYLYCSAVKRVKDLRDISDEVVKVAFFEPNAVAPKLYEKFTALASDFKLTLSSAYWIDIMKKDSNKGNGLRQVMKRFQLQPEEVVAFGDYMNDYEMMQVAYYSYAMKNAYPELKEAARFETEKTNDEGGVTDTIQKLLAENKN